MNAKSILYGCRKCFQKFKLSELSQPTQFCQTCSNSNNSTSYKQCNYCKCDFKNTIPGDICTNCKSQLKKHGEPLNCTICKLQNVFGNAVICARCSHYRSKFGDARECDNCCHLTAFFKDDVSRQKVDGQVLCWLCTYYYKVLKSKIFKGGRERRVDMLKLVDIPVPTIDAPLSRTDSSHSLLSAEPITKRSRIDDECGRLMYNNDSISNEHLLKVNSLQEDIKQFRRRIITKDNELLAKDTLITGLKADLFQNNKDYHERELSMKDRWEKERQLLTEKIRCLQRENVNILKSGKKRRQVDTGLHYLTKNPLTRVPQSVVESTEVVVAVMGKDCSSGGEDSPR